MSQYPENGDLLIIKEQNSVHNGSFMQNSIHEESQDQDMSFLNPLIEKNKILEEEEKKKKVKKGKKAPDKGAKYDHYAENMLNLDRKKKSGEEQLENPEDYVEIEVEDSDFYKNNSLPEKKKYKKIRVKKEDNNPVKKVIYKAPIVITRARNRSLDQKISDANEDFFRIKQYSYLARRQSKMDVGNHNFNARWSGLSLNQQIKRKRKANTKIGFRNAAKAFSQQREQEQRELHGPDALPVVEPELTEERINTFLAINLDQFHLNTDRDFTANLAANYALTDEADKMEKMLEQVVNGKVEIPPERIAEVTKQIDLLKSIKEWMDARLDLIKDPYYVLLSSRELADSTAMLEGLRTAKEIMPPGRATDRTRIRSVENFLAKYERVKNCQFNRRRFRDENDLTYRDELRTQTAQQGVRRSEDISRRKLLREERETREGWQARARDIVSQKKSGAAPEKKPAPATMELFTEKQKAFMELDLSAFHFNGIEPLLENHAVHDQMFEQGKEMERILAEVMQDEQNNVPDELVIPVRARLSLFRDLRRRQANAFRELTSKDPAMDHMSLNEWINVHDLILVIDPKLEEQRILADMKGHNDHAEALIRGMNGQLRPGQDLSPEKAEQAKKQYQKNQVFWEFMKSAKADLEAQDIETTAYIYSFFEKRGENYPELSNTLLYYLRGKTKEETDAVLERISGEPGEQMALHKELADRALKEVNLESFRLNTGNPAAFMKDFKQKLHESQMIAAAEEAVDKIERIRKDHPEAPVPEGYDEEYQKELRALSDFARDHIENRMNILTGMADKVNPEFLGAMDIRELTLMKADRKAIREDLNKPADEEHQAEKAAAEAFFNTADQLIRNRLEIGDLKHGDKQKVASVDTKINPVYQTYRLAYGIKGKADEFDEGKRLIYDKIDAVNESPLFSSREELQSLRDRCIATLSDFEPNVPEYLYYDLTTPVLKDLALRKLKENLSTKEIMDTIEIQRAAGIKREKDPIQPEWGEKEKDALDLMGDLAGEQKEGFEGAESLFNLLQNHAEILTDMAIVSLKNPSEEIENRKRYRKLKETLATGENLSGILKEEENILKEYRERLDNARKDSDEDFVKYLESQVRVHEKEVESVKKSLEDYEENKDAYKKELKDLSYLEPGEKEIEDREAVLKENYRKLEELEEKERDGIGGDPADVELHGQFRLMDELTRNRKEIEGLLEKEEAKENKNPNEIKRLQTELDGYDASLEEVAGQILELEQAKKNKISNAEALRETIARQEKELEKLKNGAEIPLDVFGNMSRKMEGPEGILAKEIGSALSPVVKFLAKKAGEKGMKLNNIRKILREKDGELMGLLGQANDMIRSSMDKAYSDVTAQVKEVTKYMFENLNTPVEAFASELSDQGNGQTDKKEAYYLHQYDKEDKKHDNEEMERIRRETEESLKKDNADVEAIMRRHKEQMSYVGPDALFMKQAKELFTLSGFKNSVEQEAPTLESLYHKNWFPDEKSKDVPGEGAFVRNVLQNYFDKASIEDKKSMMTTMVRSLKPKIRDRAHAKTNKFRQTGMYLGGLLRGAGPLLQKLMQGVPSKYLMAELSEAVEDVKSKLTSIPDSYVNEKFQQMIDESNQEITEIKKLQSLGAASVGETFLCRVYGKKYPEGKQVVIKILRPDAKKRIDREEDVMKQCAEDTSEGMLATYEGQLTKIREELDLTNEAKNCESGAVYEKKLADVPGECTSVHVMKEIAPKKDYLVLDKADGVTIDRYTGSLEKNRELQRKPFYHYTVDKYTGTSTRGVSLVLTSDNIGKFPEARTKLVKELNSLTKRKQHLEKVTEMWIRESIFGDGFYHGDMHAGNIMIDDNKATILDYGNATKLTKDQVSGICALSAAAMYGDARTFLDRFLLLLPEEQQKQLSGEDQKDPQMAFEKMREFTIQKNELRQKLYDIFKLGTEEQAGDKLNLALMELQKHGFQIPIAIYSYVQSQVRLSNALDDLNAQETGLRADIRALDHIGNEKTMGQVDFMMLAQSGAKQAQKPETYYKGLLQATSQPDEAEFVNSLMDREKDQEGKTAFEKKYMPMYDKINLIMSGKATYEEELPMADDEYVTKPVPVPEINIAEWKKDYEAYLPILAAYNLASEENDERIKKGQHASTDQSIFFADPRYLAWKKAKEELNGKLINTFTLPDGNPNGLLEGFGNHYELQAQVGDALLGKREAFDELVNLFENTILPVIQLAKELRTYLDKGGNKDKAKELFEKFKDIQGTMSNRNQVIFDIQKELSYDRMGTNSPMKPQSVADSGVRENDTTQFRETLPQWQALSSKKEKDGLTPEEEKQFIKLGQDLVESRCCANNHDEMRTRIKTQEQQLAPWFMDKEDGKALYQAFAEFKALREEDMKLRDKNWADTSLVPQRNKAMSKFLAIYRKIANRRLSVHVKAYDQKVPEEKRQRDFNKIFEDVVKTGPSFFGLTPNMTKIAGAVGMFKAKAYNSGDFKPGLDLMDTVPEKLGEKPQPIILKDPDAGDEDED